MLILSNRLMKCKTSRLEEDKAPEDDGLTLKFV